MKPTACLLAALTLLLVSWPGASARAATCTRPRGGEPRVGNWCSQEWVDYFWNAYDFDKRDWDDGFGFSQGCNLSMPLGRTFNAIYVLNYADGRWGKSRRDFSGSVLHWGGNYSMREIDELDGRCGDGSARATTRWGWFVDNYTRLFMPFFYSENVVQRAGTLLHESRHADWCGHNGNDGVNKCPARSNSCDESLTDGCSGFRSPRGKGAFSYQAIWLWRFTFESDSITGTTTRKQFARDEANRILDTMFDKRPCFNITSSGAKVSTCTSNDSDCPEGRKCCEPIPGRRCRLCVPEGRRCP